MEMKLRDVPILYKDMLDAMAATHTCSREELLRDFFEREAEGNAVMQNDLKWESLFVRLRHFLDENNLEWIQLLSMLSDDWEKEIKGDGVNE